MCAGFFFFLVKRSFPQVQTDKKINTEHTGREMILNQSLAFIYNDMIACIYIRSDLHLNATLKKKTIALHRQQDNE